MIINSKIFKIFISLLVLVLISFSIDWYTLLNIKLNITFIDIILITFLLASSLFLRIYRWHLLINNKNNIINLKDSIQLFFVGQSLNIVLPSGAGDVAKGYYGYKWTGIKERMLAISLIDKLIAIGSILFFTPFAFFYSSNYLILIAGILSTLPFIFLFYFNFFNEYKLFNIPFKFIFNKIKKIDLELLISHTKIPTLKIFISFIISIVAWIVTYTTLYLCFKVVGLSIPIETVIYSIPFLTLGRLFPFTLNGIGSDEALIIIIFSSYASIKEAVLIAALLYRIILIFIPAILGLIILLLERNR